MLSQLFQKNLYLATLAWLTRWLLLELSVLLFGHTTWYTTGLDVDTRAYFLAATMVIAVPTGIKIFSWIATMWGGSIEFRTPMLFAIAMCYFYLHLVV